MNDNEVTLIGCITRDWLRRLGYVPTDTNSVHIYADSNCVHLAVADTKSEGITRFIRIGDDLELFNPQSLSKEERYTLYQELLEENTWPKDVILKYLAL